MFELDLKDGTRVVSQWFDCQQTYLGLIYGEPNRELNERFLARIKENAMIGKGEGKSGSWLKVLWFQNGIKGLPIPPQAVLDRLEWRQTAHNFDD